MLLDPRPADWGEGPWDRWAEPEPLGPTAFVRADELLDVAWCDEVLIYDKCDDFGNY